MSELTQIALGKKDALHADVVVRSFREDALPNEGLTDSQEIATTGLVLLCAVAFYSFRERGRKMLPALYAELGQRFEPYSFQKFFKPATTNQFVESARIVEVRSNFDEFYIEDWVARFGLSAGQRRLLFDIMEDPEDPSGYEPNQDFPINLFGFADWVEGPVASVADVLGEERFARLQPLIHFELRFRDAAYLERLGDLVSDSTLDSYIASWLPKEE